MIPAFLHMLFASRHIIYDIPHYNVGGERFYPYGECPSSIYISDNAFQGEQEPVPLVRCISKVGCVCHLITDASIRALSGGKGYDVLE